MYHHKPLGRGEFSSVLVKIGNISEIKSTYGKIEDPAKFPIKNSCYSFIRIYNFRNKFSFMVNIRSARKLVLKLLAFEFSHNLST